MFGTCSAASGNEGCNPQHHHPSLEHPSAPSSCRKSLGAVLSLVGPVQKAPHSASALGSGFATPVSFPQMVRSQRCLSPLQGLGAQVARILVWKIGLLLAPSDPLALDFARFLDDIAKIHLADSLHHLLYVDGAGLGCDAIYMLLQTR
jgi:hypothetical protein